jgi:hypothetical protein
VQLRCPVCPELEAVNPRSCAFGVQRPTILFVSANGRKGFREFCSLRRQNLEIYNRS